MKKFFIFITILLTSMIAVSCDNDNVNRNVEEEIIEECVDSLATQTVVEVEE